jgi:hypothetical protein
MKRVSPRDSDVSLALCESRSPTRWDADPDPYDPSGARTSLVAGFSGPCLIWVRLGIACARSVTFRLALDSAVYLNRRFLSKLCNKKWKARVFTLS